MLQRIAITAGLMALAYYVGIQVRRGEDVQKRLDKEGKSKPQEKSQDSLKEE